jgi:hypothetical protein
MTVKTSRMKTWSKLAKNKRRPSEYEMVTTNLQTRHRHRDSAYELSPAPGLAMNEWYRQNVFDSPLQHDDWEEFCDPDALIYRVYTRSQDSPEEYIDGLLNEHNEIEHDAGLQLEWLDALENFTRQEDIYRLPYKWVHPIYYRLRLRVRSQPVQGFRKVMNSDGYNELPTVLRN